MALKKLNINAELLNADVSRQEVTRIMNVSVVFGVEMTINCW